MVRILTFSTLFPSSVRPGHGIFVETRLRELMASGNLESRVVAPVPWFFSKDARYGDYAKFARTPLREFRNGLDVQHPRYLLPPGVGMNVAPIMLAVGARGSIRKLLDEGFDFDVIDAHYYYPDGVAAGLLARHFGKPFTVTARGSDINLIGGYSIPRRWMQWTAKRAMASIGVSRALTEVMAQQVGMSSEKLLVMPNGVDLDRFHIRPQESARVALGWPAVPTLLSVGNLVENKGHHIAIEAISRLPAFRLVVAGEGPEREKLETSARQGGVSSRVEFVGRLDQDQLAMCYSAADILVLPSSREGWPNVLLESMACGTPVVATAVGGVAEIITSPSAGRMIAHRDATDLCAAIADLWNHLPGREAVRSCAESCSWQRTSDAQLKLFTRIATDQKELTDA